MLKTKYPALEPVPARTNTHTDTFTVRIRTHVRQCLRMSVQLLLLFEGLEVAQLYLFPSHKTVP